MKKALVFLLLVCLLVPVSTPAKTLKRGGASWTYQNSYKVGKKTYKATIVGRSTPTGSDQLFTTKVSNGKLVVTPLSKKKGSCGSATITVYYKKPKSKTPKKKFQTSLTITIN